MTGGHRFGVQAKQNRIKILENGTDTFLAWEKPTEPNPAS